MAFVGPSIDAIVKPDDIGMTPLSPFTPGHYSGILSVLALAHIWRRP